MVVCVSNSFIFLVQCLKLAVFIYPFIGAPEPALLNAAAVNVLMEDLSFYCAGFTSRSGHLGGDCVQLHEKVKHCG